MRALLRRWWRCWLGTSWFGALVCPGCGELAVRRPPTTLAEYAAPARLATGYAHTDGSPLCPAPGGAAPVFSSQLPRD